MKGDFMIQYKENEVCVSVRRFEVLTQNEERLNILRMAYHSMDMYAVEKVMDAVFGVENKYKSEGNG